MFASAGITSEMTGTAQAHLRVSTRFSGNPEPPDYHNMPDAEGLGPCLSHRVQVPLPGTQAVDSPR